MKGITTKLRESLARELREQARQSGRSLAALIRDRLETTACEGASVHSISADLAGRPGPFASDQCPRQVPSLVITLCDTGPLLLISIGTTRITIGLRP